MTSTLLLPFPQRVYNVLRLCEEYGREDIISWVNNGTAFMVNNVQEFERDFLPMYFNTKKYCSFTRALYSYGYGCVRRGRQTGIYSHPRFNRNDPMSPSLMRKVTRKKRRIVAVPVSKPFIEAKKESRKAAPPNHAVSNSFIEALTKRTSSQRPPGVLNGQQILQFPSLLDEVRREDNGGSRAIVFGRLYHAIASQIADREAPQPVHQILPSGSELAGIFGEEGDSMGAQSYLIPTLSASTNPTSLHAVASSNDETATDQQSEGKPIWA